MLRSQLLSQFLSSRLLLILREGNDLEGIGIGLWLALFCAVFLFPLARNKLFRRHFHSYITAIRAIRIPAWPSTPRAVVQKVQAGRLFCCESGVD